MLLANFLILKIFSRSISYLKINRPSYYLPNHLYVLIHTHTHTHMGFPGGVSYKELTCWCRHIHTYIHICIHIHTYIYIYIHAIEIFWFYSFLWHIYDRYKHACMLSHFSRVWLLAPLWTVAPQASLSMAFSRQQYWRGLLCTPGDIPNPGIKPTSPVAPTLQVDSLPLSHQGSPYDRYISYIHLLISHISHI